MADRLSQADANARPLARYGVFMACAGVIAASGVIYHNVILSVGAMAISPYTLPITAAATAMVLGRWRPALEAAFDAEAAERRLTDAISRGTPADQIAGNLRPEEW
jgi:hypothetical protein